MDKRVGSELNTDPLSVLASSFRIFANCCLELQYVLNNDTTGSFVRFSESICRTVEIFYASRYWKK